MTEWPPRHLANPIPFYPEHPVHPQSIKNLRYLRNLRAFLLLDTLGLSPAFPPIGLPIKIGEGFGKSLACVWDGTQGEAEV